MLEEVAAPTPDDTLQYRPQRSRPRQRARSVTAPRGFLLAGWRGPLCRAPGAHCGQ
uniref:Uncharacterized protein n=1 Tax=Arundo donax TaxID=35708 RepID=A0A0A9B6H7_ARUDO